MTTAMYNRDGSVNVSYAEWKAIREDARRFDALRRASVEVDALSEEKDWNEEESVESFNRFFDEVARRLDIVRGGK